MRPARPPFTGLLALVALTELGLGCEKGPPDPPERPTHLPAKRIAPDKPLEERSEDAASPGEALVTSAVASIRESSLELPARALPAQRISFGRGRLAQLTESELVVRELSSWSIVARLPMRDARGVLELADGSLLAASADGLHRLPPNAKTFDRFPLVTLLPGAEIVADRRDRERLWVLQTVSPSLYRYELSSGTPDGGSPLPSLSLLAPSAFSELSGPRPDAFVSLKDGSFLYGSGHELRRTFGIGGKSTRIELAAHSPGILRLLVPRRVDQVWVVFRDGHAELVQIGVGHLVIRKLELGAGLFDMATNDDKLGMIRAERSDAGSRSFTLSVIDDRGNPKLTAPLPSEPAPGDDDDWVKAVTRNKTIAMSTNPPLVAVGGPTWLAVWDLKTGQQSVLAP